MSNGVFWIAVAILYLLAFRRPGLACGYVLSTFALEQCAQTFVPVAGYNNSLCNYLIAGSVVIGLIGKSVRSGSLRLPIRPPAVAVMVLLGYCYATVLWSLFPATTGPVLNSKVPYLVVFAGLAPLLVDSRPNLEDCFASVLVCATLSLGMLLVFAEWGRRGVVIPYVRWESNPLALSQVAGALLIVLALSPNVHRLSLAKRGIVAAVVLSVVLLVFLRSASRGQIVSSIATVFVFSGVSRGTRWFPVVLLGGALLLGSGFIESEFLQGEVSRNAHRWEASEVEGAVVDSRGELALRLLEFWSRSSPFHLIFGLGHGTARDARLLGGYPHVVPAEVLAEEGIVGALLYVICIAVAVVHIVRAYRSAQGAQRKLVLTVAALLVFEFLLTLKQGTVLGAPAFLLLLVLSGSLLEDRRGPDGVASKTAAPGQGPSGLSPAAWR